MATARLPLFGSELPEGFAYREDFITADEESALVSAIDHVAFSTFEMHGVAARRRVAFFGETYRETEAAPIPEFLFDLRARAAAWAGVEPDAFAMALINQYPPGAPIGWHRDAPQYGIIAGISLVSPCRMRLRPYVPPRAMKAADSTPSRRATHEIELIPRSGYLIRGPARSAYEHSIPAVTSLRYSITFRTLRKQRSAEHPR